jgi:hypothetical protein
MPEEANLERSKFIQKQKQEKQELEKKIKKLKGAMKEAAQKELDEMEEKHEADLAAFDKDKGTGGGGASSSTAKPKEEESKAAAGDFRERNWSGLSKKELEECCTERGIGKKGSKEELISKLTIFHQDLKRSAARAPASSSGGGGEAAAAPDDDDDDDDEDEDDEESSDEEDDQVEAVDPEEFEKQGKREKIIQKALRHMLKEKFQDGFPLSELEEKFKSVNVSGFSPEKLGYKTTEKFIKNQPESICRYKKKEQFVLPPK